MILKAFPDLKWIQNQSNSNFQNKIGAKNILLKEDGWPNVVLNTVSTRTKRNNIKAPFSLFTNKIGSSNISIGGKDIRLSNDTFCLVNPGQTYDLTITEDQTQTFNIHFGERLYFETIDSIIRSQKSLIDNPALINHDNYHRFCTYWKDAEVISMINKLQKLYLLPQIRKDLEDELLADFLTLLMVKSAQNTKGIEKISSQSKSTRQELFYRIGLAKDYLHDQYLSSLSIDDLAQTAMLSKYHFLRTFKEVYGCTPYQYIIKIRLHKAKSLLQENFDFKEIAQTIGFEETNSFFSFFKKHTGFTPTQYRKLI